MTAADWIEDMVDWQLRQEPPAAFEACRACPATWVASETIRACPECGVEQ